MQAVGRLGSYITQGVYTVSGPFHPFGGAVDIVVVQQQDGSFKSSPWYVRFGKFQGVLKAKEKVVGINVNGVESDFHMYLDHKGEAFFLREVDAEESESVAYPSSSGDDTDDNRARDHMRPGLPFKPKSCNFDSEGSNSLAQIDVNNVKVVARTGSSRSRILGLIFGRRSFGRGVVEDDNVKRVDSLERAEIAANLLELKWSTNLPDGGRPPREDSKLNEEACSRTEQRGISSESTKIDIAKDGELEPNAKEVINDRTGSDSQVACAEPEARIEKQLNGEEVSGLSTVDIPDNNVPEEDISTSGVQSLVECETSESSKVGMDFSSDQTPHEELCLASGGCGEVHVLAEVTVTEEATEMVDLGVPVMKVSKFHSQQTDCSDFDVSVHDVADVEDTPTFPKSQTVNMGLGHCSAEEFELNYDTKASSYINLNDQAIDDNNIKDKDVSSMLSSHQESVTDCFSRKTSRSPSASSEEESFLFSDLDKIRIDDQFDGSVSPEYADKEDNLSCEDGTEKVNQLVDANCNLHSSTEKSTAENQLSDLQQLRVMSSPIDIPRNEAAGEEFGQLITSLPNISSSRGSLGPYDVFYPLSQSLDSKSKSLQWTFPGEDDLKCLGSDDNKENQPSHEELGAKDDNNSGEFKSTVLKLPVGDLSGQSPSPGGNWRIWPFSIRRSRSRNATLPAPSDAKNTTSGNSSGTMTSTEANKNGYKPNLTKKKVRENTPTSEQLASLNLKEGRNTVSFAFSTAMLGKQRVDARIYLWKWNTHIVISDVDGTITKSDVLGQFMPLVGVDWSQTGVTHLFSAIKENGYQLLFLSARSISQAYLTRQFLLNLKKDGKALPDGPVVISPDGIFPSLYREVIRRVPHEFKIACLEDIRALFPPDRNPFYAGFGNRDTDEISYLKVGVPKGKIFIINPRGEIVVNHYLNKKSYTSLHALVNGVFPPMNSSEQQEDFNSWNFWKLPPPVIDN